MGLLKEGQPRRSYEFVEGWGMAVGGYNSVLRPRTVEELVGAHEVARAEGRPLTLRGSGCSYGDPSCSDGGIVLDMTRMNRVLDFDPETGVVEVEGGVTVAELWRYLLPRGHWPKVCSGTMYPTTGGALG